MEHNMNKVKMVEFAQHGDDRGHLVIAEGNKDIPFDIKRVFYIYGSAADVVRGQHANRESEFVLINVAGKSKVKVKDGEGNDFTPDSVLLVLASTHYNPDEYIRDYDEFVSEIKGGWGEGR